jgi:hypothetical protein
MNPPVRPIVTHHRIIPRAGNVEISIGAERPVRAGDSTARSCSDEDVNKAPFRLIVAIDTIIAEAANQKFRLERDCASH